MDTMEFIKSMFEEQTRRMDEHQKRNDEQFASLEKYNEEQFSTLEKYLTLKIDSDNCVSCSAAKKLDKLEIKVEDISTWKHIAVGAIVILGFIAPYVLPKIFS